MDAKFQSSQTCINLMRAFAGESQARNRYTFAAGQAKQQQLHVIEAVFKFTADQEKEHAALFYGELASLSGETIAIDGTYPVNGSKELLTLLQDARHNEFEEHDPVYPGFAKIAAEEGYQKVANLFSMIAKIERTHGERFGMFADMLEQNRLFAEEKPTRWLCLNCGHIHEGTEAPRVCPVCAHAQGYFVRQTLAPYTCDGGAC